MKRVKEFIDSEKIEESGYQKMGSQQRVSVTLVVMFLRASLPEPSVLSNLQHFCEDSKLGILTWVMCSLFG